MFRNLSNTDKRIAGGALLLTFLVPFQFAHAAEFDLLWSFKGPAQEDGAFPDAGLMRDASGNLFGTTIGGGAQAAGTVFKIAADGTESLLYSFTGGNDGGGPVAQLIADSAGNLYGTTQWGGTGGYGTVFKLAPDNSETVLYSFQYNDKDGIYPVAGLIMDPSGNFYGTTQDGGDDSCGCGTVFEITSGGKEKILHSFTGTDGDNPYTGSLVMDQAGNLYGTTIYGGEFGRGAIFEVASDGTETVLHSCEGTDCYGLYGGLTIGQNGNLYGTSQEGGNDGEGDGNVFELSSDGTFTVLYAFTGGRDSRYPGSGVVMDKSGNLYGTTVGTAGKLWCGPGCATVFKLAPDGTETVLHRFLRKKLGVYPEAELILGSDGYLYGTTASGGSGGSGKHCGKIEGPDGCGTVFRVKE